MQYMLHLGAIYAAFSHAIPKRHNIYYKYLNIIII